MEKRNYSSTLLFKYLNEDLKEFGILDFELREKIISNTLEPQNYQDISVSNFTDLPFLKKDDRFLLSKKDKFIRSGISQKIVSLFKSYLNPTFNHQVSLREKFKLNREQNQALLNSLKTPFFILTGGPGTGKTTTAAAIIISHILSGYNIDSISITAPTGRAAGRITESLLKSFEFLKGSNIIPNEQLEYLFSIKASTIHRLLSYSFSKNKFYKNNQNPIQSKLVILDEASMVSPELFFSLLDAIPEGGKVILLGDPDQLPPVDSQKFFKPLLDNLYLTGTGIKVKEVDSVENKDNNILTVSLLVNHRTNSQNLINFLDEIKNGKVGKKNWLTIDEEQKIFDVFSNKSTKGEGEVFFLDNSFFNTKRETETFLDLYRNRILNSTLLLDDEKIESDKIWSKISSFQILCALKQSGFVSSDFINQYLESKFRNSSKLLPRIMTYNNYNLNIFNGDIGCEYKGLVYFPIDGKNLYFPKTLNGLESAFSITVHKSQGSQYENVILILPGDSIHELNSRSMLYTGASRTKRNLLVIANQEILNEALRRE